MSILRLVTIAVEVYSVEILESLASRSRRTLTDLGIRNVVVRQGDGYYGWEEKGPFDAIIVTCAGGHVPPQAMLGIGGAGVALQIARRRVGREIRRDGAEVEMERFA